MKVIDVRARHRAGRRMTRARMAGWVPLAALVWLSACSRAPVNNAPLPVMRVTAGKASVTLSPDQAKIVRVENVQLRQFPILEDMTGSISYADDPALIQAESTLLGAAATYNLTQKELQRVNGLGQSNGIAEKEMEQAVSDAQTAVGALKAAHDALRVLGKSDAEIDRMIASGRLDTSPATHGGKWAVGSLPESDSPSVHGGQPVRLEVAAYPGRWFSGTVAEVYSSVDPNSHRVTIRAQVSDPADMLRLGMLADIVVETATPRIAISIPEAGVVREGDGTMTAWITSDGRHFTQHPISTGLRANGNIEVLKGLKPGDRVVGSGAIFLDNMLQAMPDD